MRAAVIRREATQLPERFNCVALVEVADDRDVRRTIIQSIQCIFSKWLRDPVRIALIDGSGRGETWQWQRGEEEFHFGHDPSNGKVLAISFDAPDSGSESMVTISKCPSTHTYTLSLPGEATDRANLCPLFAKLYLQLCDMRLRSVVAAGAELGIAANSIGDAIQATSELDSLVEYLCCSEGDVVGLADFVQVYSNKSAVVLRRQ
jgi:hypothetical protein